MSQENEKKPINVEKAKEIAKSPKGKIAAVASVVVILAVIGVLRGGGDDATHAKHQKKGLLFQHESKNLLWFQILGLYILMI